jgi:exodeoxyribonuclease VII large subunit
VARLQAAFAARQARREAALAALKPSPALVRARLAEGGRRLHSLSARLAAALPRAVQGQALRLQPVAARLAPAMALRQARLREGVAALDRLLSTVSHTATLARGYAVVRGDGQVVTGLAAARAAGQLEIEFADGRLALGGRPSPRKPRDPGPDQGRLL